MTTQKGVGNLPQFFDKDLASIDWVGFKGTFRNLIGMGALEDRHGRVYNRVKRHLETSNLNSDNKAARDEHHLVQGPGEGCHDLAKGAT